MTELTRLLENITREEKSVMAVITEAQTKLDEIQKRRKAVEMTVNLLRNESPSLGLNGSRFEGKSLMNATLDCVRTFGATGLTRPQVGKLLKDHGFTFSGHDENYYASVSITLERLVKKGLLEDYRGGGGTKYFRPKNSAENKEGRTHDDANNPASCET